MIKGTKGAHFVMRKGEERGKRGEKATFVEVESSGKGGKRGTRRRTTTRRRRQTMGGAERKKNWGREGAK